MTYDPYLRPDLLRATRNRLLQRVVAPAIEPLTLDEVKLYLRVDTVDEDTLLSDLIVTARMIAEHWLKRSLISQSWKAAYDYGIPASIPLSMGPVDSITSVVTFNRDTTSQTVDSSTYWLNAAQNALILNCALFAFRIEITYATGYGSDAGCIPGPIKTGLLSHIAAMYDNRGEDGDTALPEQAVALYMPYREVRL